MPLICQFCTFLAGFFSFLLICIDCYPCCMSFVFFSLAVILYRLVSLHLQSEFLSVTWIWISGPFSNPAILFQWDFFLSISQKAATLHLGENTQTHTLYPITLLYSLTTLPGSVILFSTLKKCHVMQEKQSSLEYSRSWKMYVCCSGCIVCLVWKVDKVSTSFSSHRYMS